MKKYWELTKPWKWLLFSFLVFGFWLLGWSKKIFFGFSVCKKSRRFIWGSIYSCTMGGFFRIFKKAVSELICTRLYIYLFTSSEPQNFEKNNSQLFWHYLLVNVNKLGDFIKNFWPITVINMIYIPKGIEEFLLHAMWQGFCTSRWIALFKVWKTYSIK